MVRLVSLSAPAILPHVLLNKREELIPLLVGALVLESDAALRSGLISALFNLVKSPDAAQSRAVLGAAAVYAAAAGPERLEAELLPLCWEQIGDKHAQRRRLVLHTAAVLAPHLPAALLSSLVLSMVEQMWGEEKEAAVRVEAIRTLSTLLLHVVDGDKFEQFWRLTQRALLDPDEAVATAAASLLLPTLALWAHRLDRLTELVLHFLKKILQIVTSPGMSQSGSEFVMAKYSACAEILLPRLFWAVISEAPEETHDSYKPPSAERLPANPTPLLNLELMAGGSERLGRLLGSFDARTAQEWFQSWPQLDFVLKTILPDLVKVAAAMEVTLSKAMPAFTRLIRTLCIYFGQGFSTYKIRPIFTTALSEAASKTSALLPVLCVGVLSAFKTSEELAALRLVIREELRTGSGDGLALSISLFELAGQWSAAALEPVLGLVWELVSSREERLRKLCAALVARLAPRLPRHTLETRILPALLTLSGDTARQVKVTAVLGFPRIIETAADDERVMEKVCVQLGTVFEEADPFVLVPLFRCFSAAAAGLPPSFRDDFVLAEVCVLVGRWATTGGPRVTELGAATFELLSAVSCAFLSPETLATAFLPALQGLLPFLDPERQKIGVSILREAERKAGGSTAASTASDDLGVEEVTAKVMSKLKDMTGRVSDHHRSLFTKK